MNFPVLMIMSGFKSHFELLYKILVKHCIYAVSVIINKVQQQQLHKVAGYTVNVLLKLATW